MKKYASLVFSMVFAIGVWSCGTTYLEETENYVLKYNTQGEGEPRKDELMPYVKFLDGKGIFGEHNLEKFKPTEAVEGKINGSFFLGSGSFGGQISSEDKLRFAWRTKDNVIIISHLPVKWLYIQEDESKNIPTIRFKFAINEFRHYSIDGLERTHLNSIIDPDFIVYATLRISSKQLAQEIYLPHFK
jgi:hypothetical protein